MSSGGKGMTLFAQKRAQLIEACAIALVIVVTLISLIFYCVERANVARVADILIDVIIENDGTMPSGDQAYSDALISQEAPYETRYTVVDVSRDGIVKTIQTKSVSSLSDEDVRSYVGQAFAQHRRHGFVGEYRYGIDTGDGNESDDDVTIVLLDRGRQLNSVMVSVDNIVMIAGVLSLIVVIIVYVMSDRILSPLIESYEKQRKFVADAGHDLKTPLSVINADTELIEMEQGESEWTADVRQQVEKMTGLVTSLMTLSRMDNDATSMSPLDFSDLVRNETCSFKSVAKTSEISLDIDIEDEIRVNGNASSLSQMVRALMDNAIKYSSEEGRVSVSLTRKGRNCILTVTNRSDAVTDRDTSKWFDRLWQSDKARTHKDNSYGIGLAVVESVVRQHNGKITADVSDDDEVTMTVTMPVERKGKWVIKEA